MEIRTRGCARAGLTAICLLFCILIAGCNRSPEARAARFLSAGKARLAKQDYSRSILYFRNAAAAAPGDAEPHYQMALAHMGRRDARAAIRSLLRALELNPEHSPAQLKLSEMMAASRRREVLENAQNRVRSVLAAEPGDPDALHTLARIEWGLGQPDQAITHLREALERAPGHLRSALVLARIKLARKDPKGAEGTLRQAVERARTPDSLVTMGSFYLYLGKADAAEKEFRKALALDAGHSPALLALGSLLERSRRDAEAERIFRRLAELPGTGNRSHHALFLFRSGRKDQAVAAFEAIAKANPDDRMARSRLVAAYVGTSRMSDAERVLQTALKRNPGDLEALAQRAQLLMVSGRNEEAQRDLAEAVRLRPDSAQVHYLLAKSHELGRRNGMFRQELSEALRLDPGFLAARLELSRLFRETKNPEAARDLIQQAPADQQSLPPVVVERNWTLLQLRDAAGLRKSVSEGLKTFRTPDLLLQDGLLKLLQKDPRGAELRLEEALRMNPEDLRALEALADSFAARNQAAAAGKRIRSQVATHPQSAALRHFLGEWLRRQGDLKAARDAFLSEKTLRPEPGPADMALARIDIAERRLEEARKQLLVLAAADERDPVVRILLGSVEEQLNNPEAAIVHFRRAVELDPRNAVALNDLAFLLADRVGRPAEALQYAEQAKKVAPESPGVDDTLGWVYYRNGLYQSAISHLEKAVARQPNPRRQYHLAMAYHKGGKPQRAREVFEAALKADPTIPEMQTAKALMGAPPR